MIYNHNIENHTKVLSKVTQIAVMLALQVFCIAMVLLLTLVCETTTERTSVHCGDFIIQNGNATGIKPLLW